MSDGDLLVWLPGLVFRDGYDVRFKADEDGRIRERREERYRADADRVWKETHGDAPRSETVFEFDADYAREHIKRVKWTLDKPQAHLT